MDTGAGRGGQWFASGGGDYADFRPDYPPEIAAFVAEQAPDTRQAVDVGCGTGQFTRQLAEHFDTVIGVDPSADQIANAAPAPHVRYQIGTAEDLAVPDGSVGAITAAQAAHWFDLDAFYRQVRHIAEPGGVLALITYGSVVLDEDLAARFDRFYTDELDPYWPPERLHVRSGYSTLEFPFPHIEAPSPVIEREWTLDEFTGYLGTWSGTRRARDNGDGGLLESLHSDLAEVWGEVTRPIRWPVTVVAGRIDD